MMKWLPLTLGMTVLVLSLAVAVLTVTRGQQQVVQTKAVEVFGSLGLSPASGEYIFSPGQTYPVGIVVDAAGKSVDGVDVIINFDPKKVQVVGSSVSTTTLFERFPLNKVDNGAGRISFSALTFSPKAVVGIAATFSFKPTAPGEINLDFEFKPGATTDSNIAEHGTAKDVLGKVENAKFVFK